MNVRYKMYYLTDNPFPEDAAVNPFDDDIRRNGQIFNEEIRRTHLEELRNRINRRINIIYVGALTIEKGIGKSALMVYVWRELRNWPQIASVFLRPAPTDTPERFASKIIRSLHDDGYLWRALKQYMFKYAEDTRGTIITKRQVEHLLKPESTPQKVDVGSYVFPPKTLIDNLTEHICQKSKGIKYEVMRAFILSYLSSPPDFPRQYERLKLDPIEESFKSLINFMQLSGFYCYAFIDQFEYVVEPLGKSKVKLAQFCNDMRRLLEASAGKMTYIVSLHSEAHGILARDMGCRYFRSIADPDRMRMIPYLTRLDPDGKEAIKLTLTYLSHFRGEYKPPSDLFPFDEESIKYLNEKCQGVPRPLLMALNRAIEQGLAFNASKIDVSFIKKHEDTILPVER